MALFSLFLVLVPAGIWCDETPPGVWSNFASFPCGLFGFTKVQIEIKHHYASLGWVGVKLSFNNVALYEIYIFILFFFLFFFTISSWSFFLYLQWFVLLFKNSFFLVDAFFIFYFLLYFYLFLSLFRNSIFFFFFRNYEVRLYFWIFFLSPLRCFSIFIFVQHGRSFPFIIIISYLFHHNFVTSSY